jgi:flagellar hook-length control protein FliK
MHHPVVLDGFHRKSLLAQNGQPLSSRYTPENPVAAQMSNVPSTIPSHTQGSNEMESSTKLNIEAKPLLSNLQTNHAFNTAQVAEGQSNSLSTHSTTSMDKVQGSSEWASVKVDPQGNKWGQQMLQVLHDRVSFQAQQNLQEAKIRLDPPELGKLDLIVRVEGDRLNVQLNASSMATREALIQVSERLRAELQDQNFVHVDVNVGSERDQQAQSEHQNSEDSPHIHSAHSQSSERHDKTQSDHWLNTHA